MEIIFIIIIIFVVIMLIGGFTAPLAIDTRDFASLPKPQEWHCERVVWDATPTYTKSIFEGTMKLKCDFEPIGRSGINGLKSKLLTSIPETAKELHAEPTIQVSNGITHAHYDLTLEMEAEREKVQARGQTKLETDDNNYLTAIFTSEKMKGSGQANFLRQARSEVRVKHSLAENHYEVVVTNSIKVKKPWYILFPGTFVSALKNRLPKEMEKRSEKIVVTLANNL